MASFILLRRTNENTPPQKPRVPTKSKEWYTCGLAYFTELKSNSNWEMLINPSAASTNKP